MFSKTSQDTRQKWQRTNYNGTNNQTSLRLLLYNIRCQKELATIVNFLEENVVIQQLSLTLNYILCAKACDNYSQNGKKFYVLLKKLLRTYSKRPRNERLELKIFPGDPAIKNLSSNVGDVPGSPVVKNLPSNAGHMGSIPGWETEIPHVLGQQSPSTTTRETHVPQCLADAAK